MPDLHIVRPSSGEAPPTWDAYNAACAALEKHRRRADDAEAEVARLNAELEPARYVWGDPGCAGEDRECDEYFTEDGDLKPDVKWCSHVGHRVATFADVWARERLEALVEDIGDQARNSRLPDTAAELADRIDEELDAIAHAVGQEFGTDAYSASQARTVLAELKAEREAWLKDPGRKELAESYQREFELREEVARLRRELKWQTGRDNSHCHVVRDGDTEPCPAPPGEPHVDASGREWAYLNDYADEAAEGCA